MKNPCLVICLTVILVGICLASCESASERTIIEMELTEQYDTSDPFIDQRLFYVTDNVETLHLKIAFGMEGESGKLEIADNRSKQVMWSKVWDGTVDDTKFTVSLDALEKEKEYVVSFTGTKIKHASILISSQNSFIKERAKPLKE